MTTWITDKLTRGSVEVETDILTSAHYQLDVFSNCLLRPTNITNIIIIIIIIKWI